MKIEIFKYYFGYNDDGRFIEEHHPSIMFNEKLYSYPHRQSAYRSYGAAKVACLRTKKGIEKFIEKDVERMGFSDESRKWLVDFLTEVKQFGFTSRRSDYSYFRGT